MENTEDGVNPHPQKVIASLRLKKATSVIDYSLFALTLRDCRK